MQILADMRSRFDVGWARVHSVLWHFLRLQSQFVNRVQVLPFNLLFVGLCCPFTEVVARHELFKIFVHEKVCLHKCKCLSCMRSCSALFCVLFDNFGTLTKLPCNLMYSRAPHCTRFTVGMNVIGHHPAALCALSCRARRSRALCGKRAERDGARAWGTAVVPGSASLFIFRLGLRFSSTADKYTYQAC